VCFIVDLPNTGIAGHSQHLLAVVIGNNDFRQHDKTTNRITAEAVDVFIPNSDSDAARYICELNVAAIGIGSLWEYGNANSRKVKFGASRRPDQIQIAARAGWQETFHEPLTI
jgi:hypothetical protein